MKILFVCLGNICRSPLAAGIMKKKLHRKKLQAEVDSAGFEDFHTGDGPDPRSVYIASKHGIDITDHRARMFSASDFDNFDRIYVMDTGNFSDVMELARNEQDRKKVHRIMNSIHPGKNKSVPDPYFKGKESFEKVYKLLDKACDSIVSDLKKDLAMIKKK
jgi:protein-tyrosine phosphatase